MSSDFKVKPKIQILFSIIMCLFGWASLIFRSGPAFHQHIVFNLPVDRILDLGVFAVSAFAGPFGLLYYSWTLEVSNTKLKLSRFFGIIRNEYSFNDIRCKALMPHQKHRGPSIIKIVFNDGVSVKVDSYSSNFKSLWSYFEQKQP